MPRRKDGTLLHIEIDLLRVAIELRDVGQGDCYGYALAKSLAGGVAGKRMIGHGTLYKALARLTEAGLLASSWEDAAIAEAQARPRRRLYRVTGEGLRAWAAASGAPRSPGGAVRAATVRGAHPGPATA